MKNKALDELFELIKTPDYTAYFPDKDRREKLNEWVARWICEEEAEQLVMDKKFLDSEFMDVIKYRLIENLAEKLIEDNCGQFQVEERKITAKLVGLRRR